MTDSADRLFWPDFVRSVAIFAVIVVHVAGVPASQFASLPRSQWWWANGYDALVRPCIPLFVMLSGGLLLTRVEWNVSYFVRRRLGRVVVPFVAWSLLYVAWNYLFSGEATSLETLLRRFASGMAEPPYPHLWYLPLIIGLYVLVPILRVYVVNATLSNQLYFTILWFFVTGILPELESWLGIVIAFPLTLVYGWVGYFVLGATLSNHLPPRLAVAWFVVASASVVVGFVGTLWGTYVLSARAGDRLNEHFYSQLSLTVMMMSIGTFVLLRDWGIRLEKALAKGGLTRRFLVATASASFGIYLVHRIFVELLPSDALGFSVGPLSFHPSLAIPVSSVVIFLASFAVVLVMRNIKLLRWLAP
jgi:surface polysaccharide O-acyltransferase-like enzyme